jgi:hypothetical protein
VKNKKISPKTKAQSRGYPKISWPKTGPSHHYLKMVYFSVTTITTQISQAIQAVFGYTPSLSFTVVINPVPADSPVTSTTAASPVNQVGNIISVHSF